MKTLKDLNLKEEDNFKIRKMLIDWVEAMNYCYKEKSEFYPNGSPFVNSELGIALEGEEIDLVIDILAKIFNLYVEKEK